MKLKLKTEGLSGDMLAFVEGLNKKFDDMPETLTKEDAQQLIQTEVNKANGEVGNIKVQIADMGNTEKEGSLANILAKQGIKINEMSDRLAVGGDGVDPLAEFKKELEDSKGELDRIRKDKSGTKAFTIKVAAVTTIASSVTQNQSSATALRLGNGEVFNIQRGQPFILDFVSVGRTDSSALLWFDELAKEGDFAVVAEGALKPLVQYKFERRSADYRKVAGYTAITDEFTMDYPRLVTTIRRLMQRDCTLKMNSLILTDLIAAASAYSYPALALKIDNADNYAAIGAAISQLQSLYFQPNVLVLNPADAWQMRLIKASDGHYIMPPFTWNGQTFEFGKVIVDPAVAVGYFLVGDGSRYNVDLRGDIIVRIGYANDDFIRNQYSMVVEQYFFNYIANSQKPGLIYASFASVKTAIETP